MRDAHASGVLPSPELPTPRLDGDGCEVPLPPVPQAPQAAGEDMTLQMVIELSRKEVSNTEMLRQKEEEELERILQLSLTEK